MKKSCLLFCILLTFFLIVSVGGSLLANDDAVNVDRLSADIVKAFKPVYSLSGFSVQELENLKLASKPFITYRLVLTGEPLRGLINETDAVRTARSKKINYTEFADIVLIPENSGFRLDEAMLLANPENVQDGTSLFFKQYGLAWRNLSGGLKRFVAYVGSGQGYYWFAASNLPLLMKLREDFKLAGGFELEEYLAEALSAHDTGNFTAEMASRILPASGNKAIPHIRKAITDSLLMDDVPYPHFRALVRINTPEAFDVVNRYALSEDPEILLPLFDAVITCLEPQQELLPCYKAMLTQKIAIPRAIAAYEKLGRKDELRPVLLRIMSKPDSYANYRAAAMTFARWRNDDKIPPAYSQAFSQITALLLRNEDIDGSGAYYDFNENGAARQIRLAEEDEKRIEPVIKSLMQQTDMNLIILTALDLATLSDNVPQTAKGYVVRVRRTGAKILRQLPPAGRAEAREILKSLCTNSSSPEEAMLLRSIMQEAAL